MSDASIELLQEQIKGLRELVGLQNRALINLWGIAKMNNFDTENNHIEEYLKECEQRIKEVTEKFTND